MNIYRCVSEEFPERSYSGEPPEYGCSVALVVAETRGKAKYMAVMLDRTISRDIQSSRGMANMPKWSIIMTRKNVNLPAGDITMTARIGWWSTAKEILDQRDEWRRARLDWGKI
jgi:hypothetical protein